MTTLTHPDATTVSSVDALPDSLPLAAPSDRRDGSVPVVGVVTDAVSPARSDTDATAIPTAGPDPSASLGTVVRDLGNAFAQPIAGDRDRGRRRAALAILLGSQGLDAAWMQPTPTTPDVVVDRTVGWALVRLGEGHRGAAVAARSQLQA